MRKLKIDMDTKILLAIERLHTAQSYGTDMISSKISAMIDARDLINDAETISEMYAEEAINRD